MLFISLYFSLIHVTVSVFIYLSVSIFVSLYLSNSLSLTFTHTLSFSLSHYHPTLITHPKYIYLPLSHTTIPHSLLTLAPHTHYLYLLFLPLSIHLSCPNFPDPGSGTFRRSSCGGPRRRFRTVSTIPSSRYDFIEKINFNLFFD